MGSKALSDFASEHFRFAEFACNHCGELAPDGIPELLLEKLEKIREHYGLPMIINSGYRCPTHNRNCGGAVFSQHKLGTAADFYIKGVDPAQVFKDIDPYHDDGGLGKYPNFTHIDVRGTRARW